MVILGGRGPGSAVAAAWVAEAPLVWAAILLVVLRFARRDGIECLVGVLEWLLGFRELFLFITVDLMLSSDMTYVLICLLRVDRRRMDMREQVVQAVGICL